MDISIRFACAEDLPTLARINGMDFPGEEEKALRELPVFIDEKRIICAVNKLNIVGLLYWIPKSEEEWELTQITIDKNFMRKGIGTSLVKRFIDIAKENGVRKISADIRPENTASRSMFAKLGAKEVGTKNFGESVDRILIEIIL